MPKFYKLKHIETGLYYHKNIFHKFDDKWVKSNLTKKGRVYETEGTVKSVLRAIEAFGYYNNEGKLMKTGDAETVFKIERLEFSDDDTANSN